MHIYFLIDMLIRMLIAKFPSQHAKSFSTICEMITTVPFLVVYPLSDRQDIANSFAYRFCMMLDTIRFYFMYRLIRVIQSPMVSELLLILNSALFLVLFAACYISLVETEQYFPDHDPDNNFNFHNSAFFILTSISIIGYGSYVVTVEGRVFLIFFLGLTFATIPGKSSEIVRLLGSRSFYQNRDYKKVPSIPHIVLIGQVSQSALFNFLQEYFHEDHKDYLRHCVVLKDGTPDPNVLIEISNNTSGWNATQVIYMQGSPYDLK